MATDIARKVRMRRYDRAVDDRNWMIETWYPGTVRSPQPTMTASLCVNAVARFPSQKIARRASVVCWIIRHEAAQEAASEERPICPCPLGEEESERKDSLDVCKECLYIDGLGTEAR